MRVVYIFIIHVYSPYGAVWYVYLGIIRSQALKIKFCHGLAMCAIEVRHGLAKCPIEISVGKQVTKIKNELMKKLDILDTNTRIFQMDREGQSS